MDGIFPMQFVAGLSYLPMQLKWRATFIEESAPKATLRRTQSEPQLYSGADAEFAFERDYVAVLEDEVNQLISLPKQPSQKQQHRSKSSKRKPSASSIGSAITRCPSPTRGHLSGDEVATIPSTSAASTPFNSEPPSEPPSGPAPVGPLALRSQAVSAGSAGHPQLCNRPCIQFQRGECQAGVACRFCHLSHGGRGGRTPHLDKRHREQLLRLPFAQRAAVALPIMVRQVEKLGVTADAQQLLNAMEAVASVVPWEPRTRREGTSLTSALGALSFHSLLTVISKAPDTPDWLRKSAVEEHLERIRCAERLQGRQRA